MAKKPTDTGSTETHNLTLKKAAMIQALIKSLGVVSTAADTVGISRALHYEWLKTDPEYKSQYDALSDVQLDFIESQFHQRIKEGSDACIIFALKTKGRKRGYTEELTIRQTSETVKPQIPDDLE